MAIKRESGSKKPMAKMASKAKPRKVMVDPSSASGSINKAKKALKNSGGDYDTSRKADAYAKELKKIGIIINPAKDMYGYKPVSKTAVTKSRGSNTKKQVGDQNQREWYNGKRYKAGGIVNTSTDLNGQMLKVTQKEKDGRKRASSQRAGGKGK